jgi:hypothetical protein
MKSSQMQYLKICYYDFLPELETLATESFMLT